MYINDSISLDERVFPRYVSVKKRMSLNAESSSALAASSGEKAAFAGSSLEAVVPLSSGGFDDTWTGFRETAILFDGAVWSLPEAVPVLAETVRSFAETAGVLSGLGMDTRKSTSPSNSEERPVSGSLKGSRFIPVGSPDGA